jgi:predicted GNAT family acetyltransferase
MFEENSRENDGAFELRRFSDPRAFTSAVTPFLVQHEAENALLLGIADTLTQPASPYSGDNFLAAVERNGEVAAVAIMTPPFGPVLSRMPDLGAVDPIVEALLARDCPIPTLLGSPEIVKRFVARWTPATGQRAELAMSERIHQVTRVVQPPHPSGSWRHATQNDFDALVELARAFNEENFGPSAPQSNREAATVTARLADERSGYAFWEDGGIVALAGYGNPTPNGNIIGPVYTPPQFRNKGYATALTAALSQDLLDHGRTRVFLFTNLANPIPNYIYKKIGYEPVIDVEQWRFSEPD